MSLQNFIILRARLLLCQFVGKTSLADFLKKRSDKYVIHFIEDIKLLSMAAKKNKEQVEEQEVLNKEAEVKDTVETTVEEVENTKEEESKEEEAKEETKEKVEEAPEVKVEVKGENIDYKDRYIRLVAEFDNYKRRTAREKMDLIRNAGEDILNDILPTMDDLERAMDSMSKADDMKAAKSGVELIYNNLKKIVNQKGLKEIEALHAPFDTDMHEALTKIPAPSKKLKGKVVDVIQKGYTLNDKVIRFSKVVIGE